MSNRVELRVAKHELTLSSCFDVTENPPFVAAEPQLNADNISKYKPTTLAKPSHSHNISQALKTLPIKPENKSYIESLFDDIGNLTVEKAVDNADGLSVADSIGDESLSSRDNSLFQLSNENSVEQYISEVNLEDGSSGVVSTEVSIAHTVDTSVVNFNKFAHFSTRFNNLSGWMANSYEPRVQMMNFHVVKGIIIRESMMLKLRHIVDKVDTKYWKFAGLKIADTINPSSYRSGILEAKKQRIFELQKEISELLKQIRNLSMYIIEKAYKLRALYRKEFHTKATVSIFWKEKNYLLTMREDVGFLMNYQSMRFWLGFTPNALLIPPNESLSAKKTWELKNGKLYEEWLKRCVKMKNDDKYRSKQIKRFTLLKNDKNNQSDSSLLRSPLIGRQKSSSLLLNDIGELKNVSDLENEQIRRKSVHCYLPNQAIDSPSNYSTSNNTAVSLAISEDKVPELDGFKSPFSPVVKSKKTVGNERVFTPELLEEGTVGKENSSYETEIENEEVEGKEHNYKINPYSLLSPLTKTLSVISAKYIKDDEEDQEPLTDWEILKAHCNTSWGSANFMRLASASAVTTMFDSSASSRPGSPYDPLAAPSIIAQKQAIGSLEQGPDFAPEFWNNLEQSPLIVQAAVGLPELFPEAPIVPKLTPMLRQRASMCDNILRDEIQHMLELTRLREEGKELRLLLSSLQSPEEIAASVLEGAVEESDDLGDGLFHSSFGSKAEREKEKLILRQQGSSEALRGISVSHLESSSFLDPSHLPSIDKTPNSNLTRNCIAEDDLKTKKRRGRLTSGEEFERSFEKSEKNEDFFITDPTKLFKIDTFQEKYLVIPDNIMRIPLQKLTKDMSHQTLFGTYIDSTVDTLKSFRVEASTVVRQHIEDKVNRERHLVEKPLDTIDGDTRPILLPQKQGLREISRFDKKWEIHNCITIQRFTRGYIARAFTIPKLKHAYVVRIQKIVRGRLGRKRFRYFLRKHRLDNFLMRKALVRRFRATLLVQRFVQRLKRAKAQSEALLTEEMKKKQDEEDKKNNKTSLSTRKRQAVRAEKKPKTNSNTPFTSPNRARFPQQLTSDTEINFEPFSKPTTATDFDTHEGSQNFTRFPAIERVESPGKSPIYPPPDNSLFSGWYSGIPEIPVKSPVIEVIEEKIEGSSLGSIGHSSQFLDPPSMLAASEMEKREEKLTLLVTNEAAEIQKRHKLARSLIARVNMDKVKKDTLYTSRLIPTKTITVNGKESSSVKRFATKQLSLFCVPQQEQQGQSILSRSNDAYQIPIPVKVLDSELTETKALSTSESVPSLPSIRKVDRQESQLKLSRSGSEWLNNSRSQTPSKMKKSRKQIELEKLRESLRQYL